MYSSQACGARVASSSQFVDQQWKLTHGAAAGPHPLGADPRPLDAMSLTAWNHNNYDPHAGIWMDNRYPQMEQPQTLDMGTSFEISSLMPSNWRQGVPMMPTGSCSASQGSQEIWAKYAPSKTAFDNYLTSVGASRLGLNSRSAYGRIQGQRNLLMSGAHVPVSSHAVVFNDSDARMSAYRESTGSWPSVTDC